MVKNSFTISHTVVKDYCLVNNHEIVMIWVDLSLENSEVWYKCVESNRSPQFTVTPQCVT